MSVLIGGDKLYGFLLTQSRVDLKSGVFVLLCSLVCKTIHDLCRKKKTIPKMLVAFDLNRILFSFLFFLVSKPIQLLIYLLYIFSLIFFFFWFSLLNKIEISLFIYFCLFYFCFLCKQYINA